MNPIRFPEDNFVMTSPPSMPDGACADVHAFTDGINNCVTCWQPTPEERASIAAGGPVWVRVCMEAGTMPPISVHGQTPFIEAPTTERAEEMQGGAPCCLLCKHFTGEVNNGQAWCARWQRIAAAHYECAEYEHKP